MHKLVCSFFYNFSKLSTECSKICHITKKLINGGNSNIDPGSASAFIALIVGLIAGLGMTLKLYWFKIKEKFSNISKKNET